MASPAKAAFPPLRTRCRSDATVFSARRPPSPRPRPSRAQENRRTSGLRRWMPSALARPASCAAMSPFAPFTGTTNSNPLPGCSGAWRANQLCVNSSGSFFQIEHYDTMASLPPRCQGGRPWQGARSSKWYAVGVVRAAAQCTVSLFAAATAFFGSVSSSTPSLYLAWAVASSTS